MKTVMERYAQRIEEARLRLLRTWRRENHDRPSLIISDVNYAMFGQNDIPPRYYSPEVMFGYQYDKIVRHMETVHDDYIPVLHPWYGTCVVPSALGVPVRMPDDMDPAAESAIINDTSGILKLEKPDPLKDGQMPMVLSCIDHFRDRTDIPVCVTDCQGPFNIALTLAGPSNLFIWMYEEPEAVHALMRFCTEVLIDWITVQKKHAGHNKNGCAYPHAIELPDGFGGVAFSDDDIVAVSAEMYAEFVLPYNRLLLDAFGGGSLHFCGSARHQLENLTRLDGLKAVNNFCMADYEQIALLNKMMAQKGAVMACDFSAKDLNKQCDAVKRLGEAPEGLVIGLFTAANTALNDRGYVECSRDTTEITAEYLTRLAGWLNK